MPHAHAHAGSIDGDRRANSIDNCKFDYNPRQVDRDEDGKGDACDFDNL